MFAQEMKDRIYRTSFVLPKGVTSMLIRLKERKLSVASKTNRTLFSWVSCCLKINTEFPVKNIGMPKAKPAFHNWSVKI